MGRKRREKLARRQAAASAPPPRSRTPRRGSAIVALVVLAIAAIAFWVAQHRTQSGPAASSVAPTTPGVHYPSQGHQGHMGETLSFIEHFKYSSNPPTSGAHRETFSQAFVNAKPLPKYVQVHLLEHGNVLLQYGCVFCPDVAAKLAAIAEEFDDRLGAGQAQFASASDVASAEELGRAVVVAPYPDMRSKIALTAWTRLETLDDVDKPAIVEFINAYLANPDNIKQ